MLANKRPVVLLVEDDPGDQELTRRALDSLNLSVELKIVESGSSALAYLEYHENFTATNAPRPDIILLDLNMPGMDGKQTLEYIRGHDEFRRIPVIILTTSQHETDIIETYNLGCSSFIQKPLGIQEFEQAIQQLGTYWFKVAMLPQH